MGTTSRVGAACAALALTLLATASLAVAKDVTVTARIDDRLVQRVSYADLNLAMQSGRHVLERRVRRASHNVCEPLSGTGFGANFAYNDCRHGALDGARPQMELAYRRATEIAARGSSSIPPVAIAIVAGGAR